MQHLMIIPGRWHQRLTANAAATLLAVDSVAALIQMLFSTAGGGGPPHLFGEASRKSNFRH